MCYMVVNAKVEVGHPTGTPSYFQVPGPTAGGGGRAFHDGTDCLS